MSAPEERKVRSVAELPAAIEPGRDLWPAIEARLQGPSQPLPGAGMGSPTLTAQRPLSEGAAVNAAYVSDPRYRRERAQLLQSVQAQLKTMPAPTRAKVAASLAVIESAKKDLENALGKDPSNALLQELLINTYQDEMRVLTDVHEAGNTGRGI